MQILAITEVDFYKIDRCRRVISHDCAQKFAAIDLGVPLGCYGLSWRSDILEPIIVRSPDRLTVWIGVDQQLAAISLDEGRIIVALPLTDYLVQIVAIADVIAVLTQEKVLLFNPGGSIRFSDDLPDQGIGMTVEGENLVIQMLEGESLTLNPMRGYFQSMAASMTRRSP
ncbi:hypothetical protein [Oscillatoria acuminata]|uniref:Uncharacterized protein n=1 Tax=Oscillatoria acuminata PCC 6304 TaxID=56110 RepID=K9TKY5_9CYAN|nr:hypothetical protein [Oscillatoria acuminata]AFY83068.1 hypothetical protein Oscil6304_3502 [Oscillatoria acuminata PCC 6304]